METSRKKPQKAETKQPKPRASGIRLIKRGGLYDRGPNPRLRGGPEEHPNCHIVY